MSQFFMHYVLVSGSSKVFQFSFEHVCESLWMPGAKKIIIWHLCFSWKCLTRLIYLIDISFKTKRDGPIPVSSFCIVQCSPSRYTGLILWFKRWLIQTDSETLISWITLMKGPSSFHRLFYVCLKFPLAQYLYQTAGLQTIRCSKMTAIIGTTTSIYTKYTIMGNHNWKPAMIHCREKDLFSLDWYFSLIFSAKGHL